MMALTVVCYVCFQKLLVHQYLLSVTDTGTFVTRNFDGLPKSHPVHGAMVMTLLDLKTFTMSEFVKYFLKGLSPGVIDWLCVELESYFRGELFAALTMDFGMSASGEPTRFSRGAEKYSR